MPEVVEEPSLTEDFSDEIKEGWTGEVNLEDVKSFVEESEKVKVENASEPSVSSEAEPSVVLEDLFAAEIPKNTSPDVVRQDPEANKETLKNLEAINRDNQDKNKKTPAKNVASRPVYSGSSGRSGYSGGGSSSAKAEKGKPEEGFFKKGFKKVKDFFKGLFGIK